MKLLFLQNLPLLRRLPFLRIEHQTALLETLEEYLVREGLRHALSEDRQERFLPQENLAWAGALMFTGLLVAWLADIPLLKMATTTILLLVVFLVARFLTRQIGVQARSLRRLLVPMFYITTCVASGVLVSLVSGGGPGSCCTCL